MSKHPTGLQTLHDIDRAINKARSAVKEVANLPARASDALLSVQRKQAATYTQIAKDRLDLIGDGGGGFLGTVDKQAETLLAAHKEESDRMGVRVDESLSALEDLEKQRRAAEKSVLSAVTAYDKAAALAEAKILDDPAYKAQLHAVETAEATAARAEEKWITAQDDVAEKGHPYRQDAFFTYLQRRQYGTKSARGWPLTKILDHWVARLCDYRKAAENFRRLHAIPARLEAHVKRLDADALAEQSALQSLEQDSLQKEGVTDLHEASVSAQARLEQLDEKIEAAEQHHDALRAQHISVLTGESGPYQKALTLLSEALSRKSLPSLNRMAAQTQTRDDDRAIESLRELQEAAEDLQDDRAEAKQLLKGYQKRLKDLEAVRRKFKKKRYDAPSSVFENGNMLGALLGQVLVGALAGDDFWRQLERAQRTVRRYSDDDFGGGDWTEGLRLPRSAGGSWGGSSRRRTSIPRRPRQSLPRVNIPRGRPRRSSGSGRRSGGFRTGGGF